MLKTGDILFVRGSGTLSKFIQKITFGSMSHVGIMYNEDLVFETDGKWLKADFRDISEYKGKDISIYRLKGLTESNMEQIRVLCEGYKGTWYSYWDIVVKGAFFWLHPSIRGKVSKVLGTKKLMICNELVMRILYDVTGLEVFKEYESSNPSELYKSVVTSPHLFSRVV